MSIYMSEEIELNNLDDQWDDEDETDFGGSEKDYCLLFGL